MWLPNRRTVLLGALALSGCGFSPVYGPESGARTLLNAVEVDPPRDREGYFLVRHIEERLGRTSRPTYALSIAINLVEERMAITAENVATRYSLLGNATYALRDVEGGKVVNSGVVQSFTGYSTTGSTAATRAAEQDATERLMVILGDQIVTRLMTLELEPAT